METTVIDCDETVINLQRTKIYVFSDSVLCFGRILQHPDFNEAWKKRIEGVMSEKSYKDYDGIDGDSQRCSSAVKSMIF